MTNDALRRVLRRPAAQARDLDDRARVRHRRLRAEGVRGGGAADGALHPPGDRRSRTCAWPAASRSTASPTGASSARRPSRTCSCSPRPATPAARSGVAHYLYNTVDEKPRGARLDARVPGPGVLGRRDRAYLDGAARSTRRSRTRSWSARPRSCSSEKNVIGWFQGRMEFGPRALGGRSILADPRDPEHARHAQHEDQVPRGLPAVRALGARGEGLGVVRASTATARTCCWWRRCARASGSIPSVTHVDDSARIQTVDARERARSTTT